MPGFSEYRVAQALRDVIREIASQEIRRRRPSAQLATVSSINTTAGTCTVTFPGDSTAVSVKMYTVQPSVVGDVVLIGGEPSNRRVLEVVKGRSLLSGGRLTLTTLQTTGSSANVFVDSVTGVVSRVVSSIKYKRDVKPVDVSDDAFSQIRPVSYKARNSDFNTDYLGFIAEELAKINDPVINKLVMRDQDNKPEAIHYDRLSVVLVPVIQRLLSRVSELERRIEDLT